MSLKSTIFAVAMVMVLLFPAGRILRDQNPWSCFNFTLDESFFAQVAQNWSEGKGYRTNDTLPFDPTITARVPMAWGTNLVHEWTGEDIANSGRIFVYATFVLVLLAIGRAAYVRDKNWLAVPWAVGIFGFGLSKIPFGGYFAFGFLGEMPGFFFGVFAYRALEERRFFRAGVFATLTFLMKPTFLFFLPAVAFATMLHSGKATFRAGLGLLVSLGVMFGLIVSARNQPLMDYLALYFGQSSRIAHDVPKGTLVEFYANLDPFTTYLSVAFLILGGYAAIWARKVAPGMVTAFFVFAIASLYFLILMRRPVEKQWGAILGLTLIGFAVPWGSMIANRFQGWMPKELSRTVILGVIATWIFAVGPIAHHDFLRKSETACASKEQSAINAKLRRMVDQGVVTKENLGVWIETVPFSNSLYRLGFSPTVHAKWQDFKPTLPKYLYGESRLLFPSPEGCTPEFKGENFALLRCEKKELPPVVEPTKRGHTKAKSRT
jgi:hypothetical protein